MASRQVKHTHPKDKLVVEVKYASKSRFALNLVTSATPAIFSNMTDKPLTHYSGAEPVFVSSDSLSVYTFNSSFDFTTAL